MSISDRVPKQFVDDFELAASHYRLKESGEYEEAKHVAKNDLEVAQVCFAALAREIKLTQVGKRGNP